MRSRININLHRIISSKLRCNKWSNDNNYHRKNVYILGKKNYSYNNIANKSVYSLKIKMYLHFSYM